MTRQEFMRQLDLLLRDLPEQDRLDAIAYYEDYFDEAGPENETRVIQDLVSPEKVAFTIKRDALENRNAEYTECGYADGQEEKQTPIEKKKEKRKFPWALVLVAAIFALPIWGSILGGLAGLMAGVIGVVIALILTVVALTFAGIFGGIGVIIFGTVKIFVNPAIGLLGIGVGTVLLAVGLLFLLLCIWMIRKVIPSVFRFFVDLCQKLLCRIKGGTRHE